MRSVTRGVRSVTCGVRRAAGGAWRENRREKWEVTWICWSCISWKAWKACCSAPFASGVPARALPTALAQHEMSALYVDAFGS